MVQLTPKPHMLAGVRARNWHLSGAINELVDNGLGHGNAETVDVLISNRRGIVVADDGVGVDNINRLFTLGDASAVSRTSEIGQYGVGAKHSMIWLGQRVAVRTVRDNRVHEMDVNWRQLEREERWPEAYEGRGRAPRDNEVGTTILITELNRQWTRASVERLASDLALKYAPGLRQGIAIKLRHETLTGEQPVTIQVAPFQPTLGGEIAISGALQTRAGRPLRWRGRAGICDTLTEHQSGVHISFGYRVIEHTTEPFNGRSAPTLYVEVELDTDSAWKSALSEHKDKVIRYREELIASITGAIAPLLETASQRTAHLALDLVLTAIESQVTRALAGAGVLHFAEHAPLQPQPVRGRGSTLGVQARIASTRPLSEQGPQAGEATRPTGIRIVPVDADYLEGKLYSWTIDSHQLVLYLDRADCEPIIGWPPRLREPQAVRLVLAYFCHAVEIEYRRSGMACGVLAAFTPALREQIERWAIDYEIAPRLNRALLASLNA